MGCLRLIPKKPTNLSKLIESGFDNLSANNINYAEIRSSLIYLSLLQQKSLEETMELLIHELKEVADKKNIEFKLIFTIPRTEYSMVSLNTLLSAYNSIGRPKEVVGLDLAGDEDYIVSKDLGKMFRFAKENFGFKISIHAGETGNIKNIFGID